MRRSTPITVTALLLLGLAACGDDSTEPAAQPADSTAPTTAPGTAPTTVPSTDAASGYEHPDGADDVVVKIEQEGGFAPVQMIFGRIPSLLVSGDGRQFVPGPQIAIYPGPLLPNVQVADVGEDGIQALLALADEYGLLQAREYPAPTNIADAADTVVTINAGGETYVHRAYALGLEGGLGESGDPIDDEARQQLAEFVSRASTVPGETTAFEPDAYLVQATPIDDLSVFEVEPTVVPWPDDVEVDLGAAQCVELASDEVGPLFADANELTFFEQDDTPYQLAVKPQLPGDAC